MLHNNNVKQQHKLTYAQCAELDMYDLCADSTELTQAELETELTHAEKVFIVQFIANTLHAEATANTECLTVNYLNKHAEFSRVQDAIELAEQYSLLMQTADYDTGTFSFTLADAGRAVYTYDTEYRDCMHEYFMQACVQKAQSTIPVSANYLTLPARISNAY